MHAIWITFSEKDRVYLKKIIDEVSEKYHSPKFEPHITVYGVIDSNVDFIDKIVNQIVFNSNAFSVEKSEILQSENLWKSVYIELKMNRRLELIYKNLENSFKKFLRYEFNPHISLIYKKLPSEEKSKIINGLNIKNEFIVNKIAVQKFFPEIEKWRIVKEYDLRHLKN